MEATIKERPILFSTPMVQGILSNVKRMTRRTSGLERMNETPDSWSLYIGDYRIDKQGRFCQKFFMRRGFSEHATCPYGKPGDRLWVRETFTHYRGFGEEIKADAPLIYKADKDVCDQYPCMLDGEIVYVNQREDWKPSIHMPRAASRLLLEITDIRVERLQDISEEDAIAEGVERLPGVMSDSYKHYSAHLRYSKEELKECCPYTSSARASFCSLWESINGRESLLQNPWVWVVIFKVLEVKK
jgi:hypothetical protein